MSDAPGSAPAGLRQWLLLIAPAAGAACGTLFPWAEAAATGPTAGYIRHVQFFTVPWQGLGACVCAGLGTLVGIALVFIQSLQTRRSFTMISMLLSVGMFGMCASYVATLPAMDPTLTINVDKTTVYGGIGLGLFLAEGAALAWLFAALSALAWKRPQPR